MLEELGISFGTGVILLIMLYFVVKWAVKNGVKEAWTEIIGEKSAEEKEMEGNFDTDNDETE